MEIKMKTPEDKNVLENVLGKYRTRQLILLVIDIACILSSLMASAWLVHKMNFTVHNSKFILLIVIYIVINIMFLAIFKCYRSLWRYAGEEELISIVLACILTVIPTFLVHKFLGGNFSVIFYILNEVLVVSLIGGTRLLYRIGRRVISRCRIKDKM